MASYENPSQLATERAVFSGIGGAGNFRRPSQVEVSETTTDENGNARRRSSVWSTSSSGSRGMTLVKAATSVFRKGSTSSTDEQEPS
ncbi:hypothetical protein MMC20_006095 [Loxospora ochrophaea]|nr:hypothetical protein [Loxospora ochrophaea]